MSEHFISCPNNCGGEIGFTFEADSDDYGRLYRAGLLAPEHQTGGCKCEFTDEEIEKMETEVANDYAAGEFDSEPDWY